LSARGVLCPHPIEVETFQPFETQGEGLGRGPKIVRPSDTAGREVPLCQWPAAGPADDVDYLPATEGTIVLPPDIAAVVSDRAVAYEVRGTSLSGLPNPIYPGMVVVAEPIPIHLAEHGQGYSDGDIVIAMAWTGDEAPKLYVKQYRSNTGYPAGLWSVEWMAKR
jgi:hypothetical protein